MRMRRRHLLTSAKVRAEQRDKRPGGGGSEARNDSKDTRLWQHEEVNWHRAERVHAPKRPAAIVA
jgi:hypothetical protein